MSKESDQSKIEHLRKINFRLDRECMRLKVLNRKLKTENARLWEALEKIDDILRTKHDKGQMFTKAEMEIGEIVDKTCYNKEVKDE